MKYKAILTINAILSSISGILCMVAPAQLLSHYDVSLSPMGLVIYQFWGATLLGLGMLIWLLRDIKDFVQQRKISLVLFVVYILNCVMAFRGQYAGANARGWSMVVLFAIFALAYGIFAFLGGQKKE